MEKKLIGENASRSLTLSRKFSHKKTLYLFSFTKERVTRVSAHTHTQFQSKLGKQA